MAMNGFTGEPNITKEIILIQIKVESKVNKTAFFVVNTMVLKTGPGKEPERGVVPVSLVRPVVEPVTL